MNAGTKQTNKKTVLHVSRQMYQAFALLPLRQKIEAGVHEVLLSCQKWDPFFVPLVYSLPLSNCCGRNSG